MNAPEHIVERQRFIGGSDAAGILGVSPWATPVDVYLQKTGQAEVVHDPAREALFRRGRRLEPIVVDMLIEDRSVKVTKRSTPAHPNRYVDPEHAFIAAEIDYEWEVTQGIADELELDQALVGTVQNGEAKTVHVFANAKFGEGDEDVPIEYAAQAMHGLMVTGRQVCLFGVLFGADKLELYVVKRDDATIKAMRAREVKFWHEHVLAKVPPPPERLADCFSLWRKAPATTVEADDEVLSWCRELEQAKENARIAADCEAEAKYQIGRFMLGASGILLGAKGKLLPTKDTKPGQHLLQLAGKPLLSVTLQSQSRLDGDRLKEERPDIADQYQKAVSFFKFEKPRGKKR